MAALDATPHTPPPKSQSLPPDTVPFGRYTSQGDYRSGDLKLGGNAVLSELGRYLEVPFDLLLKCVGTPSQQDLKRTRDYLLAEKTLIHGKSGDQWKGFPTSPSNSSFDEDKTFRPLESIISNILAAVQNPGISFLAAPTKTPLSSRNNTSRPDGHLVLGSTNSATKDHWFDIAVPFEFKKSCDHDAVKDNDEKVIWSLHNIMREDPCRRFAFGITIENTRLRLWLSNRALLVVTEPIHFHEDIDGVISLFCALGSASATGGKEGLGWDPTVRRKFDGNCEFTVGEETFTTTRELSTHGTDSMVGRGTRVYEATDDHGVKVVIKNSWREAERKTEEEILNEILASCQEKLSTEDFAHAKQSFVRIRLCKNVEISSVPDETLNPMAGDDGSGTWKWVPIKLEPTFSNTRHLPSTGHVSVAGPVSTLLPTQLGIGRRKDGGIPRRVHTRTVFRDVGVALKDVTLLADYLKCLCDALKALRYLHKAGWVHCDFSVGNAIWVGGIGKLGDFEYAKNVASDCSHDIRTGIMHFMAVEVEAQLYLFRPPRFTAPDPLGTTSPDPHSALDIPPSFRMNFLHDIESVWWAFVWAFFYHTDTAAGAKRSPDELRAQWTQYQMAFPGIVGQTSRYLFFTNAAILELGHKTLSEETQGICLGIIYMSRRLLESYRKAEESYPTLGLYDVLDGTHDMAYAYINNAQGKAGGVVLCSLPDVVNSKRSRPEDETSPTAQLGKKIRM
ncbi:hypothetical protein BDN67DRAFT_941205 [Paxillus ammoniavirescens]|nr:hypothetical protein BDN67DRAFT_941205 [Paxillus ammoniavirescens]